VISIRRPGAAIRGLSAMLVLLQAAPLPLFSGPSSADAGRSSDLARTPVDEPKGPAQGAMPASSGDTERPQRGDHRDPNVTPPSVVPRFSVPVTDKQIFNARVFEEPLVPIGPPTTVAENAALAGALTAYAQAAVPETVAPFLGFLTRFPASSWRASLLMNLGLVYRRTGYFSLALDAFEEAWALSKDSSSRITADRALAQLGELNSRLGRRERLDALLAEVAGRDVGGSAGQILVGVREGRATMERDPGIAFRCGPHALERIHAFLHPGQPRPQVLTDARSTSDGTSLLQMWTLAREAGLALQMGRRSAGATLPLPAMVHWRTQHFAAILEESGGRYRAEDPTFGSEFWVSEAALDAEGSGFALIPEGPLPAGWTPVDAGIAATVWGKGYADTVEPLTPDEPKSCPVPPKPAPMAAYTFSLLNIGLKVFDVPVGYEPPVGPPVRFQAEYNQRDPFPPSGKAHSNLGPNWTFGWLSYVEDDPSNPAASVVLYARGGGQSTYTGMADDTSDVDRRNQSVLVRTSSSPIRYERRLPDGSVEVFTEAVGTAVRRVFMSQWLDPQGNGLTFVYDENVRLLYVYDALSQRTTLDYNDGDDTKVTRVTDPFGRSATFEYVAGRLAKITDVIGITSSFTYGPGDFMTALTTPYGTTTFAMGEIGLNKRWLEATDPLGGQERVEFYQDTYVYGLDSAPAGWPGGGFSVLGARNTYYWDKRAMALHPRDYSKARIYHWLHPLVHAQQAVAVLESERTALEGRVWYRYPNQNPDVVHEGTMAKPIIIGRVLDDPDGPGPQIGPSQFYQYEYNAAGKIIKAVDPLGRETRYTYGTGSTPDSVPATGSGIDLLKVEQKTGPTTYDILATTTYNAQHRPLTMTDAAGQTTTYTYNPAGQILTVTTPPRAGITENRTTTFAYDPQGYLLRIDGPVGGAITEYIYDGYGRVRSSSDSDGYTMVYDYDLLDRPTRVAFPDNTYEETMYDRLDAVGHRDRQGRTTQTHYDALRRPTTVRDPLGRTTTQQWCTCGSLDKLIDANGNATTWGRDLLGRVTSEIRPDGKTWEYRYETTTSRVKEREDPKDQITNYQYFLDDKLQQVSYAAAVIPTPTVSYAYEPVYGRMVTRTDGAGLTSFTYHPTTPPALGAGRLASVDGPFSADSVSYTHDELGRLASRGLVGFMSTLTYDTLGRLVTTASPVGTFTYAYDGPTARPLTLSYPNGQSTQYAYFPNSSDHRLQRIKHVSPAGGTISQYDYAYTPVGNIATWIRQVGAAAPKSYTFGYDDADQLTIATLTGAPPLPVPSRYAYDYDKAGNRIADQQDNEVTGATFNSRNQMQLRQPGGSLLFRGTLNEPAKVTVQGAPASIAANNTFSGHAQAAGGTTTDVAVTATDGTSGTRTNTYRVSQGTGPTTSYTYDLNGNLTGDATRTYEWDAENRLTAVKQGATTVASFAYDGAGRRVQRIAGGVTTTYIHDADGVIEERRSPGTALRYVRGPDIDQHWATRDGMGVDTYFLADHLGTIVQTTNTAGVVTLMRDYDPYGNPLAGSAHSGYAFTGRDWDSETGLYYYRARYYDPKVGRFISEDPFSARPNPYGYVDNAPIVLEDPWGLAPKYPNAKKARNGVFVICCYPGGGIGICRGPEDVPTEPNVESCMISHEEQHLKDLNSGRFGCDKQKCAYKIQEHYPIAPDNKNETECSGYCRELECLKDKPPWPKVRDRVRAVEAKIREYCGKSGCP
jgi:RHS repeat-associated protein